MPKIINELRSVASKPLLKKILLLVFVFLQVVMIVHLSSRTQLYVASLTVAPVSTAKSKISPQMIFDFLESQNFEELLYLLLEKTEIKIRLKSQGETIGISLVSSDEHDLKRGFKVIESIFTKGLVG